MAHALRTRIAIALPMLCLAFGCATTRQMSDAQRKAIRSVSVAKIVAIPEFPRVVGPSASTGVMVFGPLALLAVGGGNSDEVALKKLLDDHQIDLKEIVRREFVARLTSMQAFPAIVDEGGDARFELTIEGYGLAPGFSMRPIDKPLRPVLQLTAKLSSGDGKILWQNDATVTGLDNPLEARKFEGILADAVRTREDFERTAQFVVSKLLNNLADAGVAVGSAARASQSAPGPSPATTGEDPGGKLALADPTRAADTKPADALPVVGALWQYAYTQRGVDRASFPIAVRVTDVRGGVVHESIAIPSSPAQLMAVGADSLSFRSLPLPRSQTLVELAPYLHSVLAKREGATWSNLAGYPSGNPALPPWTITVRESGEDEVTVPAGTFKARRIEVSGRRQLGGSIPFHLNYESGRFLFLAWYAPQVQRYVKLRHETWSLGGSWSGEQLVELTSYTAK